MLTYLVLQSYGSDKMSTLAQEKGRTKVNLFSVVLHVKGPPETHLFDVCMMYVCSIYNINMLLCGLDCSLWKSPDPKLNVHTEVFLSPGSILFWIMTTERFWSLYLLKKKQSAAEPHPKQARNMATITLYNIQNNCCLKQSCELLIKHQTHKVTQRAFVARSTCCKQETVG